MLAQACLHRPHETVNDCEAHIPVTGSILRLSYSMETWGAYGTAQTSLGLALASSSAFSRASGDGSWLILLLRRLDLPAHGAERLGHHLRGELLHELGSLWGGEL